MRVEVLTPWQHEGVAHPVGSLVEADEALVRQLRGTLGQENVPAPPAPESPVPEPPAPAEPWPVAPAQPASEA